MNASALLAPGPASAFAADSATGTGPSGLQAAPGVAVGILLMLAALGWFSWKVRWDTKKTLMWLVIAAIAAIIICGYLGIGVDGGAQ